MIRSPFDRATLRISTSLTRVQRSSKAGRAARSGASAGFTLIEALAAFAIVAVLSLVVQRGLVQSRFGLAAVEDRIAAERVARSLLSEPVRASDIGTGGREGILDGHRFTLRFEPLALPLPEAEPATAEGGAPTEERVRWRPFRQRIEVATLRGPSIVVETVRLGPMP